MLDKTEDKIIKFHESKLNLFTTFKTEYKRFKKHLYIEKWEIEHEDETLGDFNLAIATEQHLKNALRLWIIKVNDIKQLSSLNGKRFWVSNK